MSFWGSRKTKLQGIGKPQLPAWGILAQPQTFREGKALGTPCLVPLDFKTTTSALSVQHTVNSLDGWLPQRSMPIKEVRLEREQLDMPWNPRITYYNPLAQTIYILCPLCVEWNGYMWKLFLPFWYFYFYWWLDPRLSIWEGITGSWMHPSKL